MTDHTELSILEWASALIISLGASAIGFLFRRLTLISDSFVNSQQELREDFRHDMDARHEDNRTKMAQLKKELSDKLEAVAAASEVRQQQILFQLLEKATRGEIRDSEVRIVTAISQRLVDLGIAERPRH